MSERIVIVGAGHGAGQVVVSLRQKKFAGEIVLIGEEPFYPYQRPPLSKKFLAGDLPAARLFVKPAEYYDEARVDVRLDTRVTAIDRDRKSVLSASGESVSYDRLVLATGARARTLDCPGVELPGVHYLRSIEDVTGIREQSGEGRRIVIVGAGYIGLEVAAVSRQLGMHVSVVELQDRVMSRVVCPEVSEFYAREHTRHGVELLLLTRLSGFSGNSAVAAVALQDSRELPADVVVIGIGILPNIELAAEAGLEVDDGIVVDDRCRTADPDIFAIGDCTNHPNELFGRRMRLESVHNAVEQAKTAAANLCGEDLRYAQVPWFWSDQYDLKLQIAGLSQGYDRTVLRGAPQQRAFSCAYLNEGRLIAVDAINCPRDFVQSKKLIADGAVVDPKLLADSSVSLKDMKYGES